MERPLLLASRSAIRLSLLSAAGLHVTAHAVRVDEEAVRQSLTTESATPHDIADTLAEMKARRIADRHPAELVLGSDQVLDFGGAVWAKPETRDEAAHQLGQLSGKTHRLLSAAVLYDLGEPVWRHVGIARLTMRTLSPAYLEGYLDRNWPDVSESVGAYKLEKEGVRLFSKIEGDYFTILGLPLLPLLSYLGQRGFIAT